MRPDKLHGQFPHELPRRERDDEIGASAVRENERPDAGLVVREHRKCGATDIFDGVGVLRYGDDRGVPAPMELARDRVDVQRAVAGEIAVTHEDEVREARSLGPGAAGRRWQILLPSRATNAGVTDPGKRVDEEPLVSDLVGERFRRARNERLRPRLGQGRNPNLTPDRALQRAARHGEPE